jgi:hypothetical protein
MIQKYKKDKDEKVTGDQLVTPIKTEEHVRGTGFTYDEDKGRTDQELPNDDSVVRLPDLGAPD